MWLLTTRGFYSVVADRSDPDRLLVRARTREDLEALEPFVENLRIHETRAADYRWRTFVSSPDWARAVVALVEEIDYPNFKAEVERRQGRDRAEVYHGVWRVLGRLQRP